MIDSILQFVAAELNLFFKFKYQLTENIVELSELTTPEGTPVVGQGNRVVITLLNTEEERVKGTVGNVASGNGKSSIVFPPVYLNLYIIISAYCPGKNYPESLKFLSGVIAFFQSNPVMHRSDYPTMPADSDKVIFEMLRLNYQDMSYIWGMLGAKHLPSVGYKLRLLIVNESQIREQRPNTAAVVPETGFAS